MEFRLKFFISQFTLDFFPLGHVELGITKEIFHIVQRVLNASEDLGKWLHGMSCGT